MIPILMAILPLVITPLVKVAEKRMGGDGTGAEKKTWVLGMLEDLWDIAAARFTFLDKFKGSRDAALGLASSAIDRKVQKLKEKGKL